MYALLIDNFEIEYNHLGNIDADFTKYQIRITDYQHGSPCFLIAETKFTRSEYNRHSDIKTLEFVKLLEYLINKANAFDKYLPIEFKILDTTWFDNNQRYIAFKQILNRMAKLHKLIDQIYCLSNHAGEEIIDWQNCEIEDQWLIRIIKEDNNYRLLHLPEDLEITWQVINPSYFKYNTKCPDGAIEEFIWENMHYQDAIKLAFKIKQSLDNFQVINLAA